MLQRLTPLFSPPFLRFRTEKAREERAQAALAKKKPKPGVVAKSSVVLEIKPWDDETDLGELEKAVRSVEMQGLLWGKSELRPVVRVHSTIHSIFHDSLSHSTNRSLSFLLSLPRPSV